VVNYKKEMIKTYFSETGLPYTVEFVEEQKYYGTVGGLFLLKGELNSTFVLTNCDTILEGNYLGFLKWHKEKRNLLTIIGSHKEITLPYGVLDMNNGSFIGIDEKPKFDLFINTGTYLCEPELFTFIKENEHLDMDKLLDRIKAAYKDRIGVYPHWDGWFDIGQWDEYRESLKKIGGI
jgi:NDP-sugar pyrophosphorylase family protein